MIRGSARMYPPISNNSSSTFGEYFGRILNISQMDFQYAFWQMSRLLVSPSRVYVCNLTAFHCPDHVLSIMLNPQTIPIAPSSPFSYNSTKTRQMIRGQFARDDPAFIVILLALMITSNMIYTIFFGHHSFWNFLAVILESVFFDFLLMTSVCSSSIWFISNKYLSINSPHHLGQSGHHHSYHLPGHSDGNQVEWLYSFDVHCNSYFIYFMISNVLVLLLTPILLQKSLFSLILGNSIFLVAVIGYFYVTFLGYDGMLKSPLISTHLYSSPALSVVIMHCTLTMNSSADHQTFRKIVVSIAIHRRALHSVDVAAFPFGTLPIALSLRISYAVIGRSENERRD